MGTHLIHGTRTPWAYYIPKMGTYTGTHLIHVGHVPLGPDLYTYMGVLIRGRILYM